MSSQISRDHYLTYIQDKRLGMITEDQQSHLDDAELTAMREIRDYLYPYYDVDAIYADLDSYRNVKRWIITIALYYVYERIPDKLVPDRIIKNYDDTSYKLNNISDGKMSVDLPNLKTGEDGEPNNASKFRWGSNTQRPR